MDKHESINRNKVKGNIAQFLSAISYVPISSLSEKEKNDITLIKIILSNTIKNWDETSKELGLNIVRYDVYQDNKLLDSNITYKRLRIFDDQRNKVRVIKRKL
jgi:hypothetical protein